MIIISYDISNDKKRNHFSKYLSKFGHRIQYSVFEIENSDRVLSNIMTEIENKFMKMFIRKTVFIYSICHRNAI